MHSGVERSVFKPECEKERLFQFLKIGIRKRYKEMGYKYVYLTN